MTIDASLNKRLSRVVRKHDLMRRNGVVYKVGRDGLIRARPRLIAPRVPLQGAFIILALLVAFKSLMFAQIGSGNYAIKVQELRTGSTIEQMGAVMMQEDPLSVAIGSFLKTNLFGR